MKAIRFLALTLASPEYTLDVAMMQRPHICTGKAIKVTTAIDNPVEPQAQVPLLQHPLTEGANLMMGVSVDVEKLF